MQVERYGAKIDLSYEHKTACPRCRKNGRDDSGDNLQVYGLDEAGRHKGAFCFSCEFNVPSQEWLEVNVKPEKEEEIEVVSGEFNDEIHAKLKGITGTDSKTFRGIRKEISSYFGVRYEYSTETGDIAAVYYPCTKGYELSGYKKRAVPKVFTSLGETGKGCELFGQFRFKSHSNTCIIVGGEHDALAAYSILTDNQKRKGKSEYETVAVVSPTIGESGAYKQVQMQYNFFNQFKKIIVAMDQDAAGEEAAQKICKVLPRGKAHIMKMRLKDPNEYVLKGQEQEFIQDFWAAKPFTPAGIHASSALYAAALQNLEQPMLSLPPFMSKASDMFGGGLVAQEISLFLAKTSIGKTTLMSALTEWWALYEPNFTLGVLSLEATAPKYSRNLLSYYLKKPLHRIKDREERRKFLEQPEIIAKIDKLYTREDGRPTFYLCDDRGANIEQVKEKILELVIQMGCNVILVDPYSDLCSGMSVSDQEELATWFKKIMKEYLITPVIVSHVRKSANGNGNAPITEDDAQGSSFLVKAAGQTVALERDKQHESPVERNRTHLTILKNRDFSETGPAGSIYYDIESSNLYDYDQWIADNPQEVVI